MTSILWYFCSLTSIQKKQLLLCRLRPSFCTDIAFYQFNSFIGFLVILQKKVPFTLFPTRTILNVFLEDIVPHSPRTTNQIAHSTAEPNLHALFATGRNLRKGFHVHHVNAIKIWEGLQSVEIKLNSKPML